MNENRNSKQANQDVFDKRIKRLVGAPPKINYRKPYFMLSFEVWNSRVGSYRANPLQNIEVQGRANLRNIFRALTGLITLPRQWDAFLDLIAHFGIGLAVWDHRGINPCTHIIE